MRHERSAHSRRHERQNRVILVKLVNHGRSDAGLIEHSAEHPVAVPGAVNRIHDEVTPIKVSKGQLRLAGARIATVEGGHEALLPDRHSFEPAPIDRRTKHGHVEHVGQQSVLLHRAGTFFQQYLHVRQRRRSTAEYEWKVHKGSSRGEASRMTPAWPCHVRRVQLAALSVSARIRLASGKKTAPRKST